MTTTINASTSAGLVQTADTSGALALQTAGTTALSISASQVVTLTNALPVASGGSGVTTSTGTGSVVLGTSPTLTSPTISGAVVSSMASSVITSGTAVASTSGTSIDFTSIPNWVKRITIVFNGVSTNGSSMSLIQLGTGTTTYTTSGYVSTSVGAAPGPGAASYTTGFGIRNDDATYVLSGHMVITNISGNIWISSHTTRIATGTCPLGGGSVTLGATLTAVRITTVNGTDTYDAGSINILYE
jgi:hypothetical protein